MAIKTFTFTLMDSNNTIDKKINQFKEKIIDRNPRMLNPIVVNEMIIHTIEYEGPSIKEDDEDLSYFALPNI